MSFFDSIFKKSEEDLVKKGLEFIEDDNTPNAIKILNKTLELYPDSAKAHYLMGVLNIQENRTVALDYFSKALKLNQNFKQAWFCKALIHNCRLEFKDALICIERVLQLDRWDQTAINIKIDLLFYLRQDQELKRFKKEISEAKLNDITVLWESWAVSENGKLLGVIDEINDQYIKLLPEEFVDPDKFKTDEEGRLMLKKKNITSIGEGVMIRSDYKAYKKKKATFRKTTLIDKPVITNDGEILGCVQNFKNNNLYIEYKCNMDIRKYPLSQEEYIILPSRGIMSMDDIILYRLPELDPKLVYKNHDEQKYMDRFFQAGFPEELRIKL